LVLTSLLQAAETGASTEPDPNLVGWWRFEETEGTSAADSSGHHRTALLMDALSFDDHSVPGRVGRALRLDGQAPHLRVHDYKGVTGTDPRTVVAWIRTSRARGEIVAWGAEDFGQMFVFGFIRGRVGVTPRGGYLYMNRETHDDEWHHLAVVVEEAERPNLHDDVTLYLDGAPAEIHDIGLLDLWPLETGKELDVRIGRGFNGLLDEVRLYDRALTIDQIQEVHNFGSDSKASEDR
jgi:hypothetical protein